MHIKYLSPCCCLKLTEMKKAIPKCNLSGFSDKNIKKKNLTSTGKVRECTMTSIMQRTFIDVSAIFLSKLIALYYIHVHVWNNAEKRCKVINKRIVQSKSAHFPEIIFRIIILLVPCVVSAQKPTYMLATNNASNLAFSGKLLFTFNFSNDKYILIYLY